MTSDIFIGIDGGASKCRARIEDATGKVLGKGEAGPANIRLSIDASWNAVFSAINMALQQANLRLENSDYKFHLGLGLAGCEIPALCKEFLMRSHPFATIRLRSDGYTACLGAHAGEDGAIIVIGTGVVGLRIYKKQSYQVSGWGFPHSDEGSGAWLGLEVVRLACQACDGRIADSKLLKAVRNRFSSDFSSLVAWANRATSTEYAQLAPLVIEHFNQQDCWAVYLVKRAAYAIEKVADALQKNVDTSSSFALSLFGGLAEFIVPCLRPKVRAQLVPCQHDATVGAIYLLKKNL